MSALDTFDWFVSRAIEKPDEEMKAFMRSQREYLFELREEDERQRFVRGFIQELNARHRVKQKK